MEFEEAKRNISFINIIAKKFLYLSNSTRLRQYERPARLDLIIDGHIVEIDNSLDIDAIGKILTERRLALFKNLNKL